VEPFTSGATMMVAAGSATEMIVDRSFLSELDGNYGDCLSDLSTASKFSSYCFDYIVRSARIGYSQKYCTNLCIQKKIIDLCDCQHIYFPLFKTVNVTLCLNMTHIQSLR
jgi:Amiloride-sensitive sodium channel